MPYPIIEIDSESVIEQLEQLGTKEKFWFYDKNAKLRRLFKIGRIGTGENWAEKISSELAKLLCLPCADYDFAKWKNKKGVVTNIFVPKDGRLVHGNEILAKIDKGYPEHDFYNVKEYKLRTVAAIMQSLKEASLPRGYKGCNRVKNNLGMFLGYLLFDCWISNPDRHHENWGFVLDSAKRSVHLAPTYDHASGLGCRLTDEERNNRLTTKDIGYSVRRFVEKTKTPFYDKEMKQMKTIEAFFYVSRFDKPAALFWLEKLECITDNKIGLIFEETPKTLISELGVAFAVEMLTENRNRLLDLRKEIIGNG